MRAGNTKTQKVGPWKTQEKAQKEDTNISPDSKTQTQQGRLGFTGQGLGKMQKDARTGWGEDSRQDTIAAHGVDNVHLLLLSIT